MSIARPRRWSVQYPVQLVSSDFVEEGKSVNMSLQGLAIVSARQIPRGTYLYVRLLPPERADRFDLSLYTVQWSAQGKIGLKASELDDQQQKRLWELLLSHSPSPGNREQSKRIL
jgi:hypothetical protein